MERIIDQDLPNVGDWKYPNSKYEYTKTILFKQTNMLGNTYFSNYVEWMGEAREQFFLTHPDAGAFLKKYSNIVLITQELHHKFLGNTYFGDMLRIELTSKNILDYSLVIVFRYIRLVDEKIIGEGWQKVCFADSVTNKPCRVPQLFLDLAGPIRE